MNKSPFSLKIFLKCYYNNLITKKSIISFLLIIGGIISNLLIDSLKSEVQGPFRLIATVIIIIALIIIFPLSLYESIKEFTSNSNLVIFHKSLFMTIDQEVSDIFKGNPTTSFITIDTSLFRENDHIQWEKGKKEQIIKFNTEIKPVLHSFPKIHYIGIAEIPFALHLGYLLSNSLAIKYYQRQQRPSIDNSPWIWPSKDVPANWHPILTSRKKNFGKNDKIAILLEFSFPISNESLPLEVQGFSIVRISVPNPSIHDLIAEKQVQIFGEKVKEILDKLKDCDEIHLFLATPVAISFVTGQMINHSAHPECFVYAYNKNKDPPYKLALKVNEKKKR